MISAQHFEELLQTLVVAVVILLALKKWLQLKRVWLLALLCFLAGLTTQLLGLPNSGKQVMFLGCELVLADWLIAWVFKKCRKIRAQSLDPPLPMHFECNCPCHESASLHCGFPCCRLCPECHKRIAGDLDAHIAAEHS